MINKLHYIILQLHYIRFQTSFGENVFLGPAGSYSRPENEFCESWKTPEFSLCKSWKVLKNSILLSAQNLHSVFYASRGCYHGCC